MKLTVYTLHNSKLLRFGKLSNDNQSFIFFKSVSIASVRIATAAPFVFKESQIKEKKVIIH